MIRRSRFHIFLGFVLLVFGCSLGVFGLYNPVLGGCITYTSGITKCSQSLNEFPVILGVALAALGLFEIIYAFRWSLHGIKPTEKPAENGNPQVAR
jgi:hypothetical protein